MFLQHFALFFLKAFCVLSALGNYEHEPEWNQVDYYIVGENRWDIPVPDGTVIHVELEAANLQEASDISGDDLQEGEVGGSFEAEDVRVEQYGQKYSVENQKHRINNSLAFERLRVRTRLSTVHNLVDHHSENEVGYSWHQSYRNLHCLLYVNVLQIASTQSLYPSICKAVEQVSVAIALESRLVSHSLSSCQGSGHIDGVTIGGMSRDVDGAEANDGAAESEKHENQYEWEEASGQKSTSRNFKTLPIDIFRGRHFLVFDQNIRPPVQSEFVIYFFRATRTASPHARVAAAIE